MKLKHLYFFRQGLKQLKSHNPRLAIKAFSQAIQLCPVKQKREMERFFYFLGFALKRMGLCGSAMKAWGTGKKSHPQGCCGQMVHRYTNAYGMVKQETPFLDDWKAFYSIQLEQYLKMKSSRKIGTLAEGDMIQQLLWESFSQVKEQIPLKKLTAIEKKKLFKRIKVYFPYFDLPLSEDGEFIPVNFTKKKAVLEGDDCNCGARLPRALCCGRTLGDDELRSGIF